MQLNNGPLEGKNRGRCADHPVRLAAIELPPRGVEANTAHKTHKSVISHHSYDCGRGKPFWAVFSFEDPSFNLSPIFSLAGFLGSYNVSPRGLRLYHLFGDEPLDVRFASPSPVRKSVPGVSPIASTKVGPAPSRSRPSVPPNNIHTLLHFCFPLPLSVFLQAPWPLFRLGTL